MNWQEIYLICFYLGLALSVFSFVAGSLHVPHVHVHVHHGGIHSGRSGGRGGNWLNIGTISAFLAWFGGTGYLLNRYSSIWFAAILLIATISGIGAASIVFWFLVKVLLKHDEPLDPADYEMTGVLGKLSIPIRPGGTGELIYSQEGTRRVAGARSEDGSAIPKGVEVIVTRYDKGIAYVRPFDDLTGDWKVQ